MSRVAAIDCGTNSIRLLVADITTREDGSHWLSDVHREMRIVRLGQGVDASGLLAPEALARTKAALADYTAIARRKGVERVRMVATSATRDAANQADFFDMVKETLGMAAEVISGAEEAELSFAGAVSDMDPADGPFVVTDIGGGSTEVVVGTWDGIRAAVTASRSVDVGCVRITERCLNDDPPTPEQVAAAERFAAAALADAFREVDVQAARTWIGVAGTMTTLSAVANELPNYDPARIHLSRVGLPILHRTIDHLVAMPRAQRAELGPMHPGRVDVINGGGIIASTLAYELAERAAIAELVVSEHDILDGIALSLA